MFDITLKNGATKEGVSPTWIRHRQLYAATAAYNDEPDMTNPTEVRSTLDRLMPGSWHDGHITRLANKWHSLKPTADDPKAPPEVFATPEEVHALMNTLDGTLLGGILDPWAGTSKVGPYCKIAGLSVCTNDVNPKVEAD